MTAQPGGPRTSGQFYCHSALGPDECGGFGLFELFTMIGPSDCVANIGPSGEFAMIGPSEEFAIIGPFGIFTRFGPSRAFARIGPSDPFTTIGPSETFTDNSQSVDHHLLIPPFLSTDQNHMEYIFIVLLCFAIVIKK